MSRLQKLNKTIGLLALFGILGMTGCLENGDNSHADLPQQKLSTPGGSGQDGVSFETVKPVFDKFCVECHKKMGQPDWSKEEVANKGKANGSIMKRVFKQKNMPMLGSDEAKDMTDADKEILLSWLESTGGNGGGDNGGGDGSGGGDGGGSDPIDVADKWATLQSCFKCHGEKGVSPSVDYPNLVGQSEAYIMAQLKAFKEGTRKGTMMPGVASGLEEEDRKFVAQYFSQINAEKVLPKVDYTEEQLALIDKGWEISGKINTSCKNCHVDKRGRGISGFPNLAGQKPEIIQKEFVAFAEGERADGMGLMSNVAIQVAEDFKKYESASDEEKAEMEKKGVLILSPQDIEALSWYFSSLIPGEPIPEQ